MKFNYYARRFKDWSTSWVAYVGTQLASMRRRWSPWYLRRELDNLAFWISEDRNVHSEDWANTSTEKCWRYARNILRGHRDAAGDADCYSVKDGTLHISSKERS